MAVYSPRERDFFIDPSGYLVTARHVIEDTDRIVVVVPDGRQLTAIVVRYSALFDAAVLKVEGVGFPTIPLGDSARVRQGQEVLVLGYPRVDVLGIETVTVTRGIVSAVRPAEGLIQIDAALNPGNSGGPVLDTSGEVVGVAVGRIRGEQGLNFAVAVNLVRTLLVDLRPVAVPPPRTTRDAPSPSPPGPGPTPASGTLIVPGESIGRIRLGMAIQEVIQVLGPYVRTGPTATGGGVFWLWSAPGPAFRLDPELVVFARSASGPIREIQTTSPAFATKNGNRVGSRLDDFKAEFGSSYSVSRNLHRGLPVLSWRGMFVSWDPTGQASEWRVTLIGVFD